MRTLHVKKVTGNELVANGWPRGSWMNGSYIRCNKKGVINWAKAPLYHPDELIERNNVKIIR